MRHALLLSVLVLAVAGCTSRSAGTMEPELPMQLMQPKPQEENDSAARSSSSPASSSSP